MVRRAAIAVIPMQTDRPAPLRRRLAAALATIRVKILLAFASLCLITGCVSLYAGLGLAGIGQLTIDTFDKSLMSINYARAAAADFAAMEAAFARSRQTRNAGRQHELEDRVATLAQSLQEDLGVAGERAQSAHAIEAAHAVERAAEEWQAVRRRLTSAATTDLADWRLLDAAADMVDQQIDLLVNYTAGDGFRFREHAVATIRTARRLNIAGTCVAFLLSALITWLLARRITRPVAAASAAAAGIARGELDTPIPAGGSDELGALLGAMAVMRDNIRAMMEREVAQRRSAQARLVDAIESSREGVILADGDGRILIANSQATDFFRDLAGLLRPGVLAGELVARAAAQSSRAEPGAASGSHEAEAALALQLGGGMVPTREARLADGRWLRISRSETREGGFVAICSDITVLKQREAELESSNLYLDAALSNMSQGLCLFDAAEQLRVVNRRFCEMYRLPAEPLRPGLPLRRLLEISVAAGNHGEQTASALYHEAASIVSRRETSLQFQELSDGRVVAVAHEPMADGGWVATYEDITERRRSEAQILFLARHDALTDLPNRFLFGERMEQAIAQLGRSSGFAVLCLDLDRFKAVNDTLGHLLGDKLLRQVAERLSACAREVDTVARLGGDEFAVIQVGLERPEAAGELARRLVATISEPYEIDGHHVVVGVSIGVAVAPGDGTSGGTLLKNADMALYRAKADGRGTFRFFEPEMDARLQARRALEGDLRRALEQGQLEPFYQPLIDFRSNRICGFEALLRWRHPERGMVSPAEFVPIAEEIGLIVPIGEWVLRRACADAARWPEPVKVAVNVSPAQFKSPLLVDAVAEALAASGLAAGRLELEITESTLLQDNDATLATLHRLRDLGPRISMDDFGTGYSSLSYLRSFPFDKIKIDQSFVRDLASKPDCAAIVRAITGLGASLGMKTTAEGVETEEQMARLRAEGCTEGQGYLFSRPCPIGDVPGLLERWNGLARVEA